MVKVVAWVALVAVIQAAAAAAQVAARVLAAAAAPITGAQARPTLRDSRQATARCFLPGQPVLRVRQDQEHRLRLR